MEKRSSKRTGYATGYAAPDPYKKFAIGSALLALAVLAAYVLQQMGMIPNHFM
jgi:hypothetical protein